MKLILHTFFYSIALFCMGLPHIATAFSYDTWVKETFGPTDEEIESTLEGSDSLDTAFEQVQEMFANAEDPIEECRQFLEAYLDEIEVRYGIRLTIFQICQLVKENVALFEMDPETREEFLAQMDRLIEM